MDNDETVHDENDEPIISIMQDIKDRVLNPKTLSKDMRQRCVEFLTGEGYGEAQIAQLLMRCEKTITRDLAEIRKHNAIAPDASLAKQIVGDMFHKALVHHKYLMRLARSPDATHGSRAQSEYMAWRVLNEMVEKMQTLGYLPLKPQEIVEDIFHHVTDTDKEQTIAESKRMLVDIERVSREAGTLDPATEEKIRLLKAKIDQAEIGHEVNKMAKKDDMPQNKEETCDETQYPK